MNRWCTLTKNQLAGLANSLGCFVGRWVKEIFNEYTYKCKFTFCSTITLINWISCTYGQIQVLQKLYEQNFNLVC